MVVFCLLVVLIPEKGMLKYPTKTVDLCTSPFNSINSCFMYLKFCCQVPAYLGLLHLHGELTLVSMCIISFPS